MNNVRILAVYGHPDDEGQVTGTLASFIARGAQVTLVCATRGEVGEISDPALGTPETLGYVRELELRAAMAQIGLKDVRLLPFRDSGMAGTPENDDPRSLHQQPAEVVTGHLVQVIRDTRPHAVFTWDPTGGYGHPDHIAVHKHTVAAFEAAGDERHHPEAGPAWSPAHLFWGASTMKRFAGIFLELQRRGLLPEGMDPARQERFEKAMAEPDPPLSNIVDVRDFIEHKRRAAGMHRSQFGENGMMARIPEDLRETFYGEERFYRANPAYAPAEALRGLEALLPGHLA
ncbi:MAG: PIG-L family deacetylase [Dehalococcoidia bacterium]|uniref:PIG-L family deacetylase n=1 Tax=Candidatus Amarobacter glycogenicus TaxID=3140699 RepID=UPI003135A649|nr:PIG-L family deacetylase [Dehalococcoidia bacterium]